MAQRLELLALPDFPLVEPGDDLAKMILDSLHRSGYVLQQGDVLVIAQKIVSKSENRYAYLKDVRVSQEALDLAEKVDKDPRLVQLILDESVEVIRHRPGVVIVEHRLGYVHANAGIDQSNIFSELDSPRVLLLPTDADQSAARLREEFFASSGAEISVIINDSAGRAWRNGTLGFAIGTAGFEPVVDMVGETDLFGRPLETTSVAVGDELAAAASFLMGQADESVPVVLIRGAKLRKSEHGSGSLVREKSQDLFR